MHQVRRGPPPADAAARPEVRSVSAVALKVAQGLSSVCGPECETASGTPGQVAVATGPGTTRSQKALNLGLPGRFVNLSLSEYRAAEHAQMSTASGTLDAVSRSAVAIRFKSPSCRWILNYQWLAKMRVGYIGS